jgi:CheY-like chemotaxis protein
MSIRESLLSVPELKLAGKTAMKTDSQFNNYIQNLNSFIDGFPAQADKLRDSLEGSKGALFQNVTDILIKLKSIYADDMSDKYRKQFDGLDKSDEDALEAFAENFIQNVSALSIDIQMAIHKGRDSRAPSASSAPPPQQIERRTNQPLILAVDNAVMFLNTMKKLLADSPYQLHCVTSGSDALDFIQNNRPDIFLLDIEMPEMDGYQLARRIKQDGQRGPILFITANSAREYVDRAVEVGASGLLMKPLRINQLLAKLREFV